MTGHAAALGCLTREVARLAHYRRDLERFHANKSEATRAPYRRM